MEPVRYVDFRSIGFSTEEESTMVVLRGHAQFSIKVKSARVRGTKFDDQLSQQINMCRGLPFGRFGSLKNPMDQVYLHCLPFLERLAPQTSLQDLSLEGFLHSPTYNLELFSTDGSEVICIEGGDNCLYTPSFQISPMRTADLPKPCQAISRFQAQKLWIAPISDRKKSLDSVQGRVTTVDGTFLYFKPRLEGRTPDFERELQVLLSIDEAGLEAHIRVPRLQGIVVSGDNGEETMGFLMTLINSPKMGIHLKSQGFWGELELHKKWEKQVTAIVRDLHANGIVWGDVNPMNVVIDEAMDAWVIDFGGMNNVEFVDDELRETVEGDLQGVTRLFKDWLPSRYNLHGKDQ